MLTQYRGWQRNFLENRLETYLIIALTSGVSLNLTGVPTNLTFPIVGWSTSCNILRCKTWSKIDSNPKRKKKNFDLRVFKNVFHFIDGSRRNFHLFENFYPLFRWFLHQLFLQNRQQNISIFDSSLKSNFLFYFFRKKNYLDWSKIWHLMTVLDDLKILLIAETEYHLKLRPPRDRPQFEMPGRKKKKFCTKKKISIFTW